MRVMIKLQTRTLTFEPYPYDDINDVIEKIQDTDYQEIF